MTKLPLPLQQSPAEPRRSPGHGWFLLQPMPRVRSLPPGQTPPANSLHTPIPASCPLELPLGGSFGAFQGTLFIVSRGNQSGAGTLCTSLLHRGVSSFSCLGMDSEDPQELAEHSQLPSTLQHQHICEILAWGPGLLHIPWRLEATHIAHPGSHHQTFPQEDSAGNIPATA